MIPSTASIASRSVAYCRSLTMIESSVFTILTCHPKNVPKALTAYLLLIVRVISLSPLVLRVLGCLCSIHPLHQVYPFNVIVDVSPAGVECSREIQFNDVLPCVQVHNGVLFFVSNNMHVRSLSPVAIPTGKPTL